jgi:hypothetical protein
MITTAELLAAVRDAQGIPSNYRLARVLDVPENTVARWQTGRHVPDDSMVIRLAGMAGLDAGATLAAMHAQRATDDGLRAAWASIAARLQQAGAAALAVILSVVIFGSPDAQARARVAVFDSAAIPAPVVTRYTLTRILGAWAAALGYMRRLAVPIGAPCSI